MVYRQIANVIPQYDKASLKNYWMKAYEQGTTTALSMATDATGGTTLAKCQLDAEGFPITSSNVRFIPYLNAAYDLWLFPTATEADADLTANAIQIADNIDLSPGTIQDYDTLTAAVADVANLSVGDLVITEERTTGNGGGGKWDVVDATTVSENGYNIVAGDATRSFVLRHGAIVEDLQYGVVRDGLTECGGAIQQLFTNAKTDGFAIQFTDGVARTATELTIDTAAISVFGTGVHRSLINITDAWTASNTLLTVNDCGRVAGSPPGEQPFYTGNEKNVVLQGFGLLGNSRKARAHGIHFEGLNDDCHIQLFIQDFKGHGAAIGKANSADTMRESFIHLSVKNCGDDKDGNDFAAVHIGGIDAQDGINNLRFDWLGIVYPRGMGLRVLPDNNLSQSQIRRVQIKRMFLHGNQQLPPSPNTDPRSELWHHETNLCEIGKTSPGTWEVAQVIIDDLMLVGLEPNYSYIKVFGGSSVHVKGFTGQTPLANTYTFLFDGAQTCSVRNRLHSSGTSSSTSPGADNLIKVVSMDGTQHSVYVSGIAGPRITTGRAGYTGDLKYLVDEGSEIHQSHHDVDGLATTLSGNIALIHDGGPRRDIQRMTITPNLALTAHDTNYATITIKLLNAGGGVGSTVGTLTTQTAQTGTVSGATNADPVVITDTGHPYSDGDVISITGAVGMTELNLYQFKVSNSAANTYELEWMDGSTTVDGTNWGTWTSGGTSRNMKRSGDWVANTPIEIAIEDRIDQGEGLLYTITKSGSGVIVPDSAIIVQTSPNLSVI